MSCEGEEIGQETVSHESESATRWTYLVISVIRSKTSVSSLLLDEQSSEFREWPHLCLETSALLLLKAVAVF